MKYISTRSSSSTCTSAEAIVRGLAKDGGLFLPEAIPTVTPADIDRLRGLDYAERAAYILSLFLTDFSHEELLGYCRTAYSAGNFPVSGTAPLRQLYGPAYILELFHGPTCAFKDFALQILPHLLTASMQKCGVDKTVLILVATSGDTGKAALAGFANVPGTKICVFYPHGGVSDIQRLQMTTQCGNNVCVAGVRGNFDDTQNGVKAIFSDNDFGEELAGKGQILSSANSINWGRLAPQIAYYFSAYCDLLNTGAVSPGGQINVTVPTGNFGNILAAYYAKCCGLPIKTLLCASNENKVLADFISTGIYDRNRPFYNTASPSMDILISSNLERLLYLLSGGDDARIRGYMDDLRTKGRYQLEDETLAQLQSDFAAGWADDAMGAETIGQAFRENGYVCDTHTAVGLRVYQDYAKATGDTTPTIIASTASPFKFCGSVLPALGADVPDDSFAMLDKLAQISGLPVPNGLSELQNRPERFAAIIGKDIMCEIVDVLADLTL